MDLNASQPPIVLHSSRLAVEIAAPGSVYAGTRFDWTGFVTQVTLDGKHTFCMPESLEPGQGTGGIGLCGEFGNEKAVGYADAQPGDLFPKLGIGLLRRPNTAEYNFFRPYEIVQRFPIQVSAAEPVPTEPQAQFVADALDCRGYAAQLTKTVRVRENWLEIACQLANVGNRTIDTHEYYHNFMGIDQKPIGPEYRLRFPYPIQLADLSRAFRHMAPPLLRKLLPAPLLDRLLKRVVTGSSSILRIAGNDITLNGVPQKAFYCRPLGFFKAEGPQWELVYLPGGVGLREYDDFTPSRVAVWGTTHVISTEVFVDIHLQPGETARWTRRYEFFNLQV